MGELSAERVVEAHNKIKGERDAYLKIVNEVVEGYDAKLEKLENHLLTILNQQGQDSFRAAGKTVYRHEEVIPMAADWNAIYKWIETEQAWGMLERRIKKTFITDYMETNKNALPPGVSVMRKFVAKIRATPKKKETLKDD